MVETAGKIIVLGKGFLGQKFEMRGYEVWDKRQFLLTSDQMVCLANLSKYDVIVNCIGKSNTRWCEDRENFPTALWVNGIIPGIFSDYCAMYNKKFVHISTGCLYDDGAFPQTENSLLAAHCNYTVTKWVGEQGCNKKDLILRPRLLFGDFKPEGRNNLLCKLPQFTRFLINQNSYTSVDTIVDAFEALVKNEQSGIFNVACDGYASPYEIAEWIGLKGEKMRAAELWESEGLHLVNNTMNLSKLREFYQPPDLKDEILRCWEALK
jgi:dTDP-4-dehydrorhamnose reductase